MLDVSKNLEASISKLLHAPKANPLLRGTLGGEGSDNLLSIVHCLLRRGREHGPLRRNQRTQRQERPRLGSRVAAPAAALFYGRKLLFKRGRAGDPESGHGPCRAQRTDYLTR
ncbi:hypothetical protein NDU88_002283 [Pleurodeles waltl]|uniref:Uncharacterized protein n=1 Tax=Pleurodeles waltl TaxID=8319 RepID=A0AAV7MQ28_PLEWA|nr:hypothetical protein NDU88_002283 [Pleurodeles waltl]